MKTLLLAIFAVACLLGQAALAQAPLPKLGQAHQFIAQLGRPPLAVAFLPPR
jgi:hypothetical protein